MVIHYLYRRKCAFFQFLSRTYEKGIFRFLYYSSKITQNNYKKSFLENWCWWLLFWLDIKSTMLENISEQKIISWEWINACTTRISFSKSAVVPTLPIYVHTLVQGDPNQSLLFQMAITLKIYISDPILVKPKYVWEASIHFSKL